MIYKITSKTPNYGYYANAIVSADSEDEAFELLKESMKDKEFNNFEEYKSYADFDSDEKGATLQDYDDYINEEFNLYFRDASIEVVVEKGVINNSLWYE